jgi:hypothetical protein
MQARGMRLHTKGQHLEKDISARLTVAALVFFQGLQARPIPLIKRRFPSIPVACHRSAAGFLISGPCPCAPTVHSRRLRRAALPRPQLHVAQNLHRSIDPDPARDCAHALWTRADLATRPAKAMPARVQCRVDAPLEAHLACVVRVRALCGNDRDHTRIGRMRDRGHAAWTSYLALDSLRHVFLLLDFLFLHFVEPRAQHRGASLACHQRGH